MAFGSGLVGDLFGGSQGSGASVWEPQQQYLTDLYSRAQQASYGNMGQQFGQQFQQPAFNAFNQMAQGGAQIPGLQQGFQNFGQQSNEALGGAINAGLGQINDNFNQNIMPGINQGAAMTGTSGGSRQGIAQGLAAGQANRQATDFVNQMQSNNWQNQMQNQFQGLQGQMGLQGQQNQAMNAAMGQAPSLANLGFGNQYGNLAGLASLIGSPVTLGGSTQSGPGILGGLGSFTGSMFGGSADQGGGAAGSAMAFMSDSRLKRNIKRIGTTEGGTPWYSFNYLWSDEDMQGVMAQEVPDARIMTDSGYWAVDYSEG